MDNETLTILQEQLIKLPKSVVSFLATPNWNDDLEGIGSLYNLNPDQLSIFRREVALVLAGLVPVDEFSASLEEETQLKGAVLEAVVAATEQKIFDPVRDDLVAFFEKEEEIPKEEPIIAIRTKEEVAPILQKEPAVSKPSITPENLPVAPEVESFLPPIPPKIEAVRTFTQSPEPSTATPHPFEEKMKQVFTSGGEQAGNLVLEPIAVVAGAPQESSFVPQTIMPTPAPEVPPVVAPTLRQAPRQEAAPIMPRKDPYREPIE